MNFIAAKKGHESNPYSLKQVLFNDNKDNIFFKIIYSDYLIVKTRMLLNNFTTKGRSL